MGFVWLCLLSKFFLERLIVDLYTVKLWLLTLSKGRFSSIDFWHRDCNHIHAQENTGNTHMDTMLWYTHVYAHAHVNKYIPVCTVVQTYFYLDSSLHFSLKVEVPMTILLLV